MFPTVLKIGSFEISSFGVMMALAFIAAGMVFTRELRRLGEDPEFGWEVLMAAALGGIGGAKLYYAILYGDPALLLSRAGLVWYGGLLGGALAVFLWVHRRRLPYLKTCDAAAPGLALGYAFGRMGCFLVGDDYGRPTDLPWGIAFPQGSPPSTAWNMRQDFGVAIADSVPADQVLSVHPTQLYEVAMALVIFAVLWSLRRTPRATGWIFGLYLVLAGLERFTVEFWRAKDDRFFGALTLAQAISLGIAIAGFVLVAVRRRPAAAESS